MDDLTDVLESLEGEIGVLIKRVRHILAARAEIVHPGLSAAAYLMLDHIRQYGPLRASGISLAFAIDKGAISRQVQHLIDLGLVEATRDPADGRASLLSISEHGQERLREVTVVRRRLLAERLSDWSPEELFALTALLGRYNQALADDEQAGQV